MVLLLILYVIFFNGEIIITSLFLFLINILQLLKLPDGTVKVLVEGMKRVKILNFNDNEKFIYH